MYLNILKKDLKRKKTMNVILLIFVILSAMFMASSVNNILAVTSGLDFFFEKAGMADYYVIALDNDGTKMSKALDDSATISEYRKEDILYGSGKNIMIDGEKLNNVNRTALLMSVDNAKLNYFAPDNKQITQVKEGQAYISGPFANDQDLEVGDKFTLVIGETKKEFEFMGRAKDAFLGSDFMGNPRFILNNNDYELLCSDKEANGYKGHIYYINTSDTSAVESLIADTNGIIFNGNNDTMKTTYIMSMIVAALLLVVSIFLIVISFIVLKYTIGFTLAEEFREIGVMKAIGIKNGSIRGIYLVKYFLIAIVGSVIGFFLSMPFSDLMLNSVSKCMYIDSENSVLISLLCSILVIGIILLFCWGSTSKIKKFSPIDAVRNGQTGERFRKKSLLHLNKSKFKTTVFLACNDITSSPKQYSIITIVFATLMLLIMILANTANTLNSDKLMFLFGATKSNVYINLMDKAMEAIGANTDSQTSLNKTSDEIEKTLEENNMPGTVHIEAIYNVSATVEDTKTSIMFQYCPDTKASDYKYDEGTAPINKNEVAISYGIAKRLNIGIGDTITFLINNEETKMMVTGLFQTFNNLGNVGRLHEDFDVSQLGLMNVFAFQVDFDEEISDSENEKRIEKLKEIYGEDNVQNGDDFVKTTTGAAEIIEAVKNMVLIITLVIVILIAVLMERSFISREKIEIALMKAVGFNNISIITYHALRFIIVSIMATILSMALCMPMTKLTIDPIMSIMGAIKGVGYEIKPLEVFILYPVIITIVTSIAAFLTAVYTNKIKSSDVADIE